MDSALVNQIIGIGFTVAVFGGLGIAFWVVGGKDARRRKRALRTPPPLPLHRGDPLLGRLASACLRQDLQTLHQELSGMYGDWDRRGYYLAAIVAELPKCRAALGGWAASAPQDPLARLLNGVAHVAWGWEARGSGLASSVSEEGWRLFRERLGVARAELAEASRLDPRDPSPPTYQILVCKALGEPDEVLEAAYREAIARDPHHFDAHSRRVNSLTKKWSGSEHGALELARHISASAPPGGDLQMLVVDALLEEWQALRRERGADAARAFLRSSAFRLETRRAMEDSILNHMHRDGHGWALLAVNVGAYTAWLLQDDPLLRRLLERLGDKAGVVGWNVAEAKLAAFVAEARVKVGLL